jgi:hypothetical protein
MGRFATIAIIALALGGATVEGYAAEVIPGAPHAAPQTAPQLQTAQQPADGGSPADQLLADNDAPGGPAAASAGPMQPPPPPPGMPPMGYGQRGFGPGPGMPPPFMERMRHMAATWGLFYNQRDKNLSNADVQILAEAILLVHGNHDWKVVNVADGENGRATFSYATADGSVIARFAVDRETGRLSRIG